MSPIQQSSLERPTYLLGYGSLPPTATCGSLLTQQVEFEIGQETAPGVRHGIHFHLGAPMARLEAEIVFTDFTASTRPAVRTTDVANRDWLIRRIALGPCSV